MKRALLLVCSIAASSIFAQSWNTTGNSGTDPSTNFLGTSDAKDLILKTNNTERIRLNTAGSVGITGADADGIALKVSGRTRIVSDVQADAFYVGSVANNHASGNSLVFLRYSNYQPNNPGILDVAGWPTATAYGWIMSLRANGKLYLGTNPEAACGDCSEFRMFVKDGIRTEKVKVDIATANGWADYVFNKNYTLRTLEEVEKHIEEKGHLPNIPSTDEVMKNGINLGEMDAKLLEKIEELTLYSIEQNKQLKSQSEEIKELKKQVQQLIMIKK
ncbi:cell wall anchor protein [Chryseobacterium bernardetii]|uniref:cell wall anchor protein n=1 Tax=Chryseobacterium bernardetii TaxID=1241978 RepID=UPI000F4FFE98|nr:cell wall anchor protein [Chryseobacterium bernardetii]AZB35039.1 cell wall anchor protein [Chryseobacterium bernardetii]